LQKTSSALVQDGSPPAPAEQQSVQDVDLQQQFQTMTQVEMADYREQVADKVLISAIKTIQEIYRA